MTIQEWITEHQLDVKWLIKDKALQIKDIGVFFIVQPKDFEIVGENGESEKVTTLFNEDFEIILSVDEQDLLATLFNSFKADEDELFFLFDFGGNYYYTPNGICPAELNAFKHLGKLKQTKTLSAFLGIHGQYELLNGSRNYNDWCKKAKFLGIKTLAICERNTLAGTIAFQQACEKSNIKPIIGETVTVRSIANKGEDFVDSECKIYVATEEGWSNLLRINKILNIDNSGWIDFVQLAEHGKGLILVVTNDSQFGPLQIKILRKSFDHVYYQIDFVQWDSNKKDEEYLNKYKDYFNSYYSTLKPVLINDAYYLDKQDAYIKKIINQVGSVPFQYDSQDQYFKSYDELYTQGEQLFNSQSSVQFKDLMDQAFSNLYDLAWICTFKIKLGELRLPAFEIRDLPKQYMKCKTNDDLFWKLIEEGVDNKLKDGFTEEYEQRIQEEVKVIQDSGFIDYFLILWDMLRWCRENGIMYGQGRGSVGGSIIAYLLDITKIDSIKYGLLFSRFLNKGRTAKELPDVDIDVAGERRDDLKKYMQERYGYNNTCAVGTYNTLQLRQTIQDIGRIKGVDPKLRSYMTAMIDYEEDQETEWKDLFVNASIKPQLKKFIKEHVGLINAVPLCLGQPKSASIHASANLIVPKVDKDGNPMTIFDWMPLRKTEDGTLISEWEGDYVAAAGFLKEDILGLRQLDKFTNIIALVKQNTGEDIKLEEISLHEKGVLSLFKKGYNEDVFHFGSQGLKTYSTEVQPDNINDLIAMIALHRPGAMNTGTHIQYVLMKEGKRIPDYDYGLEEVTKETFGLLVYQEQVMKAVQVLGNFDLVEADDVRKAMGKKIRSLLDSYKEKFIQGAISNGCSEYDAEKIWSKLEQFSSYAFNKSHATAYAVTGYISQWLKYMYPLEFWTTAFQFTDKTEAISRYISEIKKTSNNIEIMPPDINYSLNSFYADFKLRRIYWSLKKIIQVGDVASNVIIEERNKNGHFYSLKEFHQRVPKAKVKKNVLLNLILAGCFDQMYKIENVTERIKIVKDYFELIGEPMSLIFANEGEIRKEYWWNLQQREISGLGHVDYKQIVKKEWNTAPMFIDSSQYYTSSVRDKKCVIMGVVQSIREVNSKRGKFGTCMLESNHEQIRITFWANGVWDKYREAMLKHSKGRLLMVSGKIVFDKFWKTNVMQTTEDTLAKIF